MRQPTDPRDSGIRWGSVYQCLLWVGLAAAVGWLYFRHDEHLAPLLPWLVLLACPLMHVLHHRGHKGRHDE